MLNAFSITDHNNFLVSQIKPLLKKSRHPNTEVTLRLWDEIPTRGLALDVCEILKAGQRWWSVGAVDNDTLAIKTRKTSDVITQEALVSTAGGIMPDGLGQSGFNSTGFPEFGKNT